MKKQERRYARSDREVVAKFRKFFEVFISAEMFLELFGHVRTFSARSVQTRSNVLRSVRKRSDVFGNSRLCQIQRSQWWNVCSHEGHNLRNLRSKAWKQIPASPVKSVFEGFAFFQVLRHSFSAFATCWNPYEPIQTCSDAFAYVQMLTDAFAGVWPVTEQHFWDLCWTFSNVVTWFSTKEYIMSSVSRDVFFKIFSRCDWYAGMKSFAQDKEIT